MIRRARIPTAGLVLVTLLAGACATRDVPPIGSDGRPFTPAADERTLWARAEREEAALRERVAVYEDPLLDEYLARLGDRLAPDAVRAAGGPAFRVGVVRDPTLNAFALPNGRIYLHTGLLSRLENEAQLAMILGHEMAHVLNRDALRFTRAPRSTPAGSTVLGIAASVGVAAAGSRAEGGDAAGAVALGPTASAVLGLGLALAAVASIDGYGRDREWAADAGGLAMLARAGYDPRAAVRVFARLRDDVRERGAVETFLLGSDPRLSERVEATRGLLRTTYAAAATGPGTVRDTAEFGLRMHAVVRDNAYEDVRTGRFRLARAQLDRVLAHAPDDPVAHLYYGDWHRLQSQRARDAGARADHLGHAVVRYERAAALDLALAEPHRQLGLLHYQQKDAARARAAFERYLALRPDASDARRIREYLVELGR